MIRTIGVIGAGDHMRQVLLPAAVAAGLRPTVVAARTPASALAAASPYGAEVVSGAVDVATADVDAIVVAVPVDQVASVLRDVIPAGKPVYVEKPGAATSAQASELAALADRYGTRLQVGYMKRYAPAYQRLRRAIADGDLGPLTLASIKWAMGPFGGRRGLTDWLVENAVHAFDLAGYLVGPLRIADVLVREIRGEHVVLVQGDCSDDACFTMHACTTGPWWHDNETVEVLGIGASMRARNVTELALRRGDDPEQVWSPNFSIPVARNLTGTLLGFVPAVAAFAAADDHENPGPDMHQAAVVLRLVERVAAAAGAA